MNVQLIKICLGLKYLNVESNPVQRQSLGIEEAFLEKKKGFKNIVQVLILKFQNTWGKFTWKVVFLSQNDINKTRVRYPSF